MAYAKKSDLKQHIISGLVVGFSAIPLGLAFAIASGVRPEMGLYSIVIATWLVALFWGSHLNLADLSWTLVPLMLGCVGGYGYEGLLIASFLAGGMIVLAGIFSLDEYIHYIPQSVREGIMVGIAVTIAYNQLPYLAGVLGVEQGGYFIEKIFEFVQRLHMFQWQSVALAMVCLLLLLFLSKRQWSIVISVVGSTLVALLFFSGEVPTIVNVTDSSRFISKELQIEDILHLVRLAVSIAIIARLSVRNAVEYGDERLDPKKGDRTFISHGLMQMISSLLGAMPMVYGRKKSTRGTRLSGIISAFVVSVVVLLFAPLFTRIPLAALATILMFISVQLIIRNVRLNILRANTNDVIILCVTFLLVVFVNLSIAVEVGCFITALIYWKRRAELFKDKCNLEVEESEVVLNVQHSEVQ
ncbi:MAG: SulP family inorganic anion transporter, partial [Bacilli bacterium]